MEKNVSMRHSRRHSTGNFYLENTAYEDVLSRYLSGPFPSCHDNCKQSGSEHPPEHKSASPIRRSSKTSARGIKKHFTPIPKSPTKHVNITNTLFPKRQDKVQHNESKKQDFMSKLKSKPEQNDPFYIPPSRVTRRFSDIGISANGLGGDLPDNGFARNSKKNDKKIESRKDLKPAKSTVKAPGNDEFSKKVQTLNIHKGSMKPRIDHGSKKSMLVNPVGEVVQEKANRSRRVSGNVGTLIPSYGSTKPKIDNGSAKSESTSHVGEVVQEKLKKGNTVFQNGQNKEQILPKSKKDDIRGSTSQNNGSIAGSEFREAENPKRLGKLAKENDDLSSKKLKFKQGNIIDPQAESNGSRKLKFEEGKLLDENPDCQEKGISLRRLSSNGELNTPENNSVNVALKPCDLEAKKRHTRVNSVIKQTASKLIQTRKSKVKALVGAFELISGNDL